MEFTELVEDWTAWLNSVLANSSVPLHVSRSLHDACNEQEEGAERATIYITTSEIRHIPTVVGLVSMAKGDVAADDDEYFLANDCLGDQCKTLGSDGPFFCFIASGTRTLDFYYCRHDRRTSGFDSAGRSTGLSRRLRSGDAGLSGARDHATWLR